jgi:hypothetical protein
MRSLKSTLATVAGATALVAAAAASAYATVPATLTSLEPPGGAANDPDIVISVPVVDITCDTASATATLANPPAVAPPDGTLNTLNLTNCVGPLGLALTGTATLPWNLTVTGGSSPNWSGAIPNLHLHFDSVPPGTCTFDIVSSASTTYNSTSQTLAFAGGSLMIASSPAPSCFGLILPLDPVNITGSFHVS